jgi:cytochrome c oxidase subunit III
MIARATSLAQAQARARTNELTLLAVLATVTMLFAAFTSAYLIRRTSADWNRFTLPPIMLLNTVVLLASSLTLEFARHRNRSWLAPTIVLGVIFLIGQIAAWSMLATRGYFLPTSPYAAFLYMLSAVHGLHLIGGLGALLYASRHPSVIGLCAMFWHFLGGLWVYVIALLWAM